MDRGFLWIGNNRQHMTICAKMISSWLRKVLNIANAHMSLGILQVAAESAVLVAGVSIVSILQAGDGTRVYSPARHFSKYILLLWISTRIQWSVLSWALESRQLVGKYQILTYLKSCG